MKRFIYVMVALLLTTSAFSKNMNDVVTLTNQMSFKGQIKKVNPCSVIFKTEEGKVEIPAEDVNSLVFSEESGKAYRKYMQQENYGDACFKGQTDASQYHGKVGQHIAWGILFGPFGVIGAAVANPTPMKGNETLMMSKNKDLFSDPGYLTCYKKQAKKKNVLTTCAGWGMWILLGLALTAGA